MVSERRPYGFLLGTIQYLSGDHTVPNGDHMVCKRESFSVSADGCTCIGPKSLSVERIVQGIFIFMIDKPEKCKQKFYQYIYLIYSLREE